MWKKKISFTIIICRPKCGKRTQFPDEMCSSTPKLRPANSRPDIAVVCVCLPDPQQQG